MCWLVHCPANKDIPSDYVTRAQSINKDGYGIVWYDNQVESFKTMDFEEFKTKLATLTPFNKVVHLRYTSMGKTTLDNSHPFEVGNGAQMCHNGTMSTMKTVACTTTCDNNSDTRNLAEVIKLCKWERISDILPLIHQITGKTGNKLVFMESNGEVTIVNKNLGVEEDDIWYSNEYHVEKPVISYNNYSYKPKLTKVFVYGTLKKGFGNHHLLATSKFIGEATTFNSYAMIGETAAFPYVLGLANEATNGKKIKGEVYEVTSTVLARLNQLEGVPHHYKQSIIPVVDTKTNVTHIAAMYIKSRPTAHDWVQPTIDEFKNGYKEPTTNKVDYKTDEELNEMSNRELVSYLKDLEVEVYGKDFSTYKRYLLDKDELIEEISDILDFAIDYPFTYTDD